MIWYHRHTFNIAHQRRLVGRARTKNRDCYELIRQVRYQLFAVQLVSKYCNYKCSPFSLPFVGVSLVICHSAVRLYSLFFHCSLLLSFSIHFSSFSAFHRSLFTQSYMWSSAFLLILFHPAHISNYACLSSNFLS